MVGGVPAWLNYLLSSGSRTACGASYNPVGNVNSWEAGQTGRAREGLFCIGRIVLHKSEMWK